MFKKIFITLGAMVISFNVLASDTPASSTLPKIEEGKQYSFLKKLPSPEKEVTEFFSFNCPSCFRMDVDYNLANKVKSSLPKGVIFKKYSLTNYGPLSAELSEAWAIANILGITQDVSKALYNGIQVDRTIKTANDIKTVFANLGVDNIKYTTMQNNFLVKGFMVQQQAAEKDLRPNSIPAFYVNGQYAVNANGLDGKSAEIFIQDYSRVINYLLGLK